MVDPGEEEPLDPPAAGEATELPLPAAPGDKEVAPGAGDAPAPPGAGEEDAEPPVPTAGEPTMGEAVNRLLAPFPVEAM